MEHLERETGPELNVVGSKHGLGSRVAACFTLIAANTLAMVSTVQAQGASQSLGLRAVVPKFCTVGGALRPAEFTITLLVGDTGTIETRVTAFASTAVICNTTAELTAASTLGGAHSTTVAVGTFDAIDYVASVSFGTATTILTTAAREGAPRQHRSTAAVTSEATKDDLRISLTPIVPARTLVAGRTYVDTIRVMLSPR